MITTKTPRHQGKMGVTVIVHLSIPTYYQFDGWVFEYSRSKPFGPWPCRQDRTPRKRAGKKFYDMLGRFLAMGEDEQDEFIITDEG